MQRLLGLQHHRHTGKLLRHKNTSYRALAVLLAITGICMLSVSAVNHAAADTFGVSAMVEAPRPTTPAIIASPEANATIATTSTLITGSCPLITPQVIIGIRVDGILAGTSDCDSNNDFSVPITLTKGSHSITAETITISGQSGPVSSPVQVQDTAIATTPDSSITTDSPYVYLDNTTAEWAGKVTSTTGASSVYIHVDWGDGSQNNYTVSPGTVNFSHTYAALASHNMWLAVANTDDSAVSEQFAVAAYTSAPAAISSTAPSTRNTSFTTPTIAGLYGLYITIICVTAIIWLEARHAARAHAFEHVHIQHY